MTILVAPAAARGARAWLAPALGLLVVALLPFRAVLPSPSVRLPYPAVLDAAAPGLKELDHLDQSFVVATVARNAHLALAGDELRGGAGWCHPMPRSYTFGEHMFGSALLGLPVYAATRDPILTYNFALVVGLWLRGLAMFALVLHFTRHRGAAFVAGVIFALVPERIIDPTHPFAHGDGFVPLVLLFLHRVFAHGRLRDAAGLSLFTALVVLESFYPLVMLMVVAGAYVAFLAWRHRAALRRAAALLALAAAPVVALAVWLLLPYLETRAVWGVLEGRFSVLLGLSDYAPGHPHFPGVVVLVLVAAALVDRARRSRPVCGEDPRLAFVAAGALALWCSLRSFHIGGAVIPTPLVVLRELVPGLGAVRALSIVSMGVELTTSFLAGYGVLALVERRPRRFTAVVVGGLVLAVLATRLYGPLARASFGRTLRLATWDARPHAEDLELLRRVPARPTASLPARRRHRGSRDLGRTYQMLFVSYSPRPLSTCYNSFDTPVQAQVERLLGELPDPAAREALAALGFGHLFVHLDMLNPEERARPLGGAEPPGLHLLGATERLRAYELAPPAALSDDPGVLGPSDAATPVEVHVGDRDVPFTIANHGETTFRHPGPVAPIDVVVEWRREGGAPRRERGRALLPLALAKGASMTIDVRVPIPEEPGRYTARLVRAEAPDAVIARAVVDVRPSPPPVFGGRPR